MIHWLIDAALRNRFLVVAGFLLVAGWGYWALRTVPIDAIPDLSDNQVIVFTDWPGRSPQEVEDQITYPLTVSLQGLPSVRVVRSSSAFGFSMINVIFEDAVDIYFARTRVLERLNLVGKSLPPGVVPTLGPDATGVGHVFWYTVEGQGYALQDLRSLQDWFIRYQLNAVPGVAEVASVGGVVRQYQVDVDPNRLRAFRIPFSAVVDAVMRSNRNVGGNVVEASGTWTVIRGLGLIERLSDIEQIVIGAENGIPIFVRQVAEVKVGDAFRASALVKGTEEAVGGVVVARYGVSTIDVINRVKEKITALAAGLPPGVRIVSFYDRSDLIARAVDTLKHALLEETLIVTLAHMVFLMHLRSVLIVTLPLPLAVLITFLGMRYLGISANIMSLAGIAIAIGVLVDAAIVVTENAFRFLEQRRIDPSDRSRRGGHGAGGHAAGWAPDLFLHGHYSPGLSCRSLPSRARRASSFTRWPLPRRLPWRGRRCSPSRLCRSCARSCWAGGCMARVRTRSCAPLVWLYRPLLRWALRHRVLTIGAAVLVFCRCPVPGAPYRSGVHAPPAMRVT